MLGVYVGKKSGGHLNPAVTLANCVYRGMPWRKFPIYFIGQLLGAMAAAFILYGNYMSAIDNFEGKGIRTVSGPNATAGIFCTYPAEFMTRTGMFFSEFICSSLLQLVIFALADPANGAAGPFMPLALFFLIFGIGACWGWETGYAINLARDFGPRLVSYIVGYGPEVWSAGGYYFWVRCCRCPHPPLSLFFFFLPCLSCASVRLRIFPASEMGVRSCVVSVAWRESRDPSTNKVPFLSVENSRD